MSIDPVGSTDYFIIGDVVNTVHQRNIGIVIFYLVRLY